MTAGGTFTVLYQAPTGVATEGPFTTSVVQRRYDGNLYGFAGYFAFEVMTNGLGIEYIGDLPLDSSPNGLVEGTDGNFYGTTSYGGTNAEAGTVFKMAFDGKVTTLYSAVPNNPFAGSEGR